MTAAESLVAHELLPYEHHYLDLDGGQIHYLDEGSGDTVLLLHGNPAWSFLYRKIIAGLRDQFRLPACIPTSPRRPGRGRMRRGRAAGINRAAA
jgi:haloalkane dehalogenase